MVDVASEFGRQTKSYLKHFGLDKVDLQALAKLTKKDLDSILDGSKGIVLKTSEKVSQVFGLRYFEYGNSEFPYPQFEDLPTLTREAIINRKTEGAPTTRTVNKINLSTHIAQALKSSKLPAEFTSSDILKLLPKEVRIKIKSIRITDELSKGDLKDLVEDTEEKRAREKLYRLK